MINLIVATSINNVIGQENTLPWKLSSDLKRFRELTTNNVVIMGRKTFDSIGKFLPNRINMILTSRAKDDLFGGYIHLIESPTEYMTSKEPPTAFFNTTLEEALSVSKQLFPDKEIFIIGGGQIYKEALDKKIVDRIYLTRVFTKVEGDTFFPDIDQNEWQIVSEPNAFPSDEKNQWAYSFETWERK